MGRIEELAQILLRDGYVDNDADARQAALDVLLAALHRSDPNIDDVENQPPRR